jgi:hypothetical protein
MRYDFYNPKTDAHPQKIFLMKCIAMAEDTGEGKLKPEFVLKGLYNLL